LLEEEKREKETHHLFSCTIHFILTSIHHGREGRRTGHFLSVNPCYFLVFLLIGGDSDSRQQHLKNLVQYAQWLSFEENKKKGKE
jgi:hypothetical protein